jgi:hypothetical protein
LADQVGQAGEPSPSEKPTTFIDSQIREQRMKLDEHRFFFSQELYRSVYAANQSAKASDKLASMKKAIDDANAFVDLWDRAQSEMDEETAKAVASATTKAVASAPAPAKPAKPNGQPTKSASPAELPKPTTKPAPPAPAKKVAKRQAPAKPTKSAKPAPAKAKLKRRAR